MIVLHIAHCRLDCFQEFGGLFFAGPVRILFPVQIQGALIGGRRLGEPALFFQGLSQVIMGHHVIALQGNGPLMILHRFIVLLPGRLHQTHAVQRIIIVGLLPQNRGKFPGGQVQLAQPVKNHAQFVANGQVVGPEFQINKVFGLRHRIGHVVGADMGKGPSRRQRRSQGQEAEKHDQARRPKKYLITTDPHQRFDHGLKLIEIMCICHFDRREKSHILGARRFLTSVRNDSLFFKYQQYIC